MSHSPRRAFTLIELLVVISIIVVLLAVLVPGLQKAMGASQKAKCGTNLSAIGKACATYLNDSASRSYPRAGSAYNLVGKRGDPSFAPDVHTTAPYDSDKRPLNPYVGVNGRGSDAKVAQCPSDLGDAIVDPDGMYMPATNNDPTGTGMLNAVFPPTPASGTRLGTNNLYNAVGSSYIGAVYEVAAGKPWTRGIQAAFAATGPMQASAAKPASSKVLFGDGPMYGDRKVSDAKHRWHEPDKKRRAYNIVFADAHVDFFEFKDFDKAPNGVEQLAADTQGNPSRGYW